MSFAIILQDLTQPANYHWALWDIPADTTSLPEDLPMGATITMPVNAKQAALFGGTSYFGSGACGNTYEHRLFALSVAELPGQTNSTTEVRAAIDESGAVLGETFVRLQSREYCSQ